MSVTSEQIKVVGSGIGNHRVANEILVGMFLPLDGGTVDGEVNIHKGNPIGTVLGPNAGVENTTAVCVGFWAGAGVAADSQVAAVRIGRHAGYEAGGGNDVCIGHAAAQYHRSCSASVIIGYLAGRNPNQYATFNGFGCVVIGQSVVTDCPAHQYAVVIGKDAAAAATTGCVEAVIAGHEAGKSAVTATGAVMIGAQAGKNATAAVGSVLIGIGAGRDTSGNYTFAIDGHATYAYDATTCLINGNFNTRVLNFETAPRVKGYAVASLPAAGTAGRVAFATNGRKNGEGAAAGTGVLCYDDGTAWRRVSDDSTVAA